MKTFLQNKRFGFYLTLGLSLLSCIISLLYYLFYRGSNEFNTLSAVALLLAGGISILLALVPKIGRISRYLLLSGILVGLFAYVYGVYYYVSVVIADIDLHGYSAEFILLTALFCVDALGATANLFVPFDAENHDKLKPARLVASAIFALSAFATGLGIAGQKILYENEGFINASLNINPYVMEKGEGSLNTDYFESEYSDIASLRSDGEELVAEIEAEGAVLLENRNNALPLESGNKVSLFSLSSIDPAYGGEGSSASTRPVAPVSLVEALEEEGIASNPVLADWYRARKSQYAPTGYQIKDAPWSDISSDAAIMNSLEEYNDAAIFVIKRIRGENTDVSFNEPTCDGEGGNYLGLNQNEKSVLNALSSMKGTTFGKIIVLLNTPNQVELAFLKEYDIDACLWIGSVGQTGFRGVSQIISGSTSPSGKLSDTFYFHHSDNPVMANWGSFTYANYEDFLAELPSFGGKSYSSMQYASYVAYQEGMYVGYRYSETRYEDCVMDKDLCGEFPYQDIIAYPFGFGLSYTKFEYSNPTYSFDSSSHHLSLDVKNVGQVAGKESVQLYLQKPYTDYDLANHIEKPSIELVDYAKTKTLAPGESETLSFEVKEMDFASYDAYGKGSYLIEGSSDYRLAFGKDAHSAINNILSEKGYSLSDNMDEAGDPSLVKKVSLEEKSFLKESKNLFDSMDMNRYEHAGDNSIQYLSRADWIDTIPSSHVVFNLNEGMMEDLLYQNSEMEEDEEEYPLYEQDNGLNLIDLRVDENGDPIPLDNPIWDKLLEELSFEETAKLLVTGLRKTTGIESISKPATVDHNGPTGLVLPYGQSDGLGARLGDPDAEFSPPYYPCLGILASTYSKELAKKMGEMLGEDALWAGYSGFYGVGVNTHRSAYDGRAFEYYSEDGVLAGKQAANLTLGLQGKGCNAYVKHLAGYEQQNNRVGLSVWCNEQAYREIYLRPFRLAIEEGGAMNAMTSYTRVGTTLCPASEVLLEGFLREECGMKGIIVSDMWTGRYLNSQLPHCIEAGMSLTDSDLDPSILYQYKTGHGHFAARMKEAAKHILYATVHSNAMNGFNSDTVLRYVEPSWKQSISTGKTAAIIIFALASCSVLALETIAICRKRDKEPFKQGGNV